jgi:uncharacterized SAM-binding protein YcdF (DUF218 family)
MLLAARLYRAGKAGALITSGPEIEHRGRRLASEPELTRHVWLELGIQPEHIILLEGPRSTTDEIESLRKLQDERRFARLGLLTSAYHLRRAARLCARCGLDVIPVPANFAAVMEPPRPMHLIPQSDGFRSVHHACWELLGALAGR